MPTENYYQEFFLAHPPKVYVRDNLKKAVLIMRNSSDRTIFVVNNEEKLVGVVTEGDLMRALEANQFLTANISDFMNSAPVFSKTKLGEIELLRLFIDKGLLLLPIVNEFGVLLGAQSVRGAASILAKSF